MELYDAGATIPTTGDQPVPAVGHAARFVLLTDLPTRVNRAAEWPAPRRVTWRLVAANNRSIGQSSAIFPSLDRCLADIDRLSRTLPDAVSSVHFHPSEFSSDGSHWTWTVLLEQQPLALSTRRYKRRIECERALHYFLDAIGLGPPVPVSGTIRRLGERLRALPA